MLRKIIKSLIPSRGEIFFELFVEASENVHQASNLLADIVNAKDQEASKKLVADLRQKRQQAVDINKKIAVQLNEQFITPIDRGDIFHLSGIMLKLTKRIIKINKKMQIYAIDTKLDDCLIRSVVTLQEITKTLYQLMQAFQKKDESIIQISSQKADELDENVIEDLSDALEQIKQENYDMLTTMKLKEVYKAIESAIDTSATLCDSVMRIYVKEI